MNNLKNRILCIADGINTQDLVSIPFGQKAIEDWFKYHNNHGLDSNDLNDLGITAKSTDEEIKFAIIKQWIAEIKELREEREFQLKNDLGLV